MVFIARFSLKLLESILWNFLTKFHSNYFEKWTTLLEVHVRPDAEYDFQSVDLHVTQAHSSACG